MAAENTTPVGMTKDAGWEVGVSRTLPYPLGEVWEFVVGEGLALWLGEGLDGLPGAKGEKYATADGTTGEIRGLRERDRVRLTWRPAGWDHDTTVQVAVSAAANGKTVLRFHQEWLADGEERERQRGHWREAMGRVEEGLAR